MDDICEDISATVSDSNQRKISAIKFISSPSAEETADLHEIYCNGFALHCVSIQ